MRNTAAWWKWQVSGNQAKCVLVLQFTSCVVEQIIIALWDSSYSFARYCTAAAATKSRQLCPTLRPHRRQPTRLPGPWDSLGKNTGVGCHFLLQCMKVKSESEVAQSCPTLRDPMDCSPPGSSVHGILQARVLEWGAIAFSEYWTRLR